MTRCLVLSLSICLIVATPEAMGEIPENKPNPQMKAVLDQLADLHPKPIETLDAKEARKQPSPADAVAALLKKEGKSTDPEAVGDVDNRKIDGPVEKIPVRVYTPKGDGPFPVLLYFHGGGFVIATNDTYDASCRALCNGANCVVVSPEYRKAPEFKYPAAPDDALATYQWLREHAADVKGDANRIAIAGESAGGNLAIVTSLRAREAKIALPIFQLLVYPVVNNDMETESYKAHAFDKPLNKAMMGWFISNYLTDPASAADPHVTPMHADLKGLPPALVITAEIDPLMSEGKEFSEKLKSAGVDVAYRNYTGVTHEFFGMGAVVDVAKQAEGDACAALKAAFEKAGGK